MLLLALYDGQLTDEALTAERLPISLILLSNKIRAEAPGTFAWFAREGVSVRVISGDNPLTVSEVARRAGSRTRTGQWTPARSRPTSRSKRRRANASYSAA